MKALNDYLESIGAYIRSTRNGYRLNITNVNLGGSGATIGLLISMLLVARRRQKQMVALGMPPAIFQINEPVIFGIPIVLNPIC